MEDWVTELVVNPVGVDGDVVSPPGALAAPPSLASIAPNCSSAGEAWRVPGATPMSTKGLAAVCAIAAPQAGASNLLCSGATTSIGRCDAPRSGVGPER